MKCLQREHLVAGCSSVLHLIFLLSPPPPTSLLSTEVTDGHVQEISVCVLDDPTQNLHVSIFIAALAKNESNYVSKKWRL